MTGGPIQFYIATRLENAAGHREIRDRLLQMGWACSYDWTVHGSVQREGKERIAEVARMEEAGVRSADIVIVLLPGGRGTQAELGMAIALRKPIFIFADPEHGFFAQDERTCAFYHAPTVHQIEGAAKGSFDRLLAHMNTRRSVADAILAAHDYRRDG